jgi:integrase/recombinase XerD
MTDDCASGRASLRVTITTAAMLQRRFDQLTDPAAHALVAAIRQQRGDEPALLAAELLAGRRAERVSLADP